MDGFDYVVWYLLLVYLVVILFAGCITADYAGWNNACCPQYDPKEENEKTAGDEQESEDNSELINWV